MGMPIIAHSGVLLVRDGHSLSPGMHTDIVKTIYKLGKGKPKLFFFLIQFSQLMKTVCSV